jgi:hypothetical protein
VFLYSNIKTYLPGLPIETVFKTAGGRRYLHKSCIGLNA